jgi:hypothetical protein
MSGYVGLDVHKQLIEACTLDATGRVVWRGRTGCLRDELENFARTRLEKTDRVALEATTSTWSVVAILRPHVAAVVVSNPLKTRAGAEAKVKTDKVDAEADLGPATTGEVAEAVGHQLVEEGGEVGAQPGQMFGVRGPDSL